MYLNVDEYLTGLLTRDELNGFLLEIEELKAAVFRIGDGGVEQVLQSKIGAKSAQVILTELGETGKFGDTIYLEQYFDRIIEKLKQIPVAELELAIDPSRDLLIVIRDRLSEFAGQQVAVDYKVNTKLMAGARVAYAGKFFDFSLESKWPEVWNEVKDKLMIKQ